MPHPTQAEIAARLAAAQEQQTAQPQINPALLLLDVAKMIYPSIVESQIDAVQLKQRDGMVWRLGPEEHKQAAEEAIKRAHALLAQVGIQINIGPPKNV